MSRLTELYKAYRGGKMPRDDPRWEEVPKLLHKIARGVTHSQTRAKSATQGQLYGAVMDDRIEDVSTVLLTKFLEGRFDFRGQTIEPLLFTVARRELATAFRRSRSPSTVGFEGDEKTWQGDDGPREQQSDLFVVLLARLRHFRFPEYPHVREALLAFFMATNRYPGHHYLHPFGVHKDLREAVYNAAVFDLNLAMINQCDES